MLICQGVDRDPLMPYTTKVIERHPKCLTTT
jgi:hypothetical protein